jgi:uncharacterized membrane protein
MNEALTDPILISFSVGLLVSTYLMFANKEKSTTKLLMSSLLFGGIGIISSTYTYIIHNKMVVQGTTSFCSSEGFIQCGSVIGDPDWNNLFGIPWGIFGILSFSLLIFLSLCLYLDRHAKWVDDYLNYSWWASLAGLPFVALLVAIELTQVEQAPHICPFCTIAHLSLIGYVAATYYLKINKSHGKWSEQER